MIGGVATARSDGNDLDGVRIGVVGDESVDDSELFGFGAGKVETESEAAGEVARDVPVTKALACLAARGKVGDGLQRGVDEGVVKPSEIAYVIDYFGQQCPVVRGTSQRIQR